MWPTEGHNVKYLIVLQLAHSAHSIGILHIGLLLPGGTKYSCAGGEHHLGTNPMFTLVTSSLDLVIIFVLVPIPETL